MSKISKKNINEIRELISLGCDYSGVREFVDDTAIKCLKQFNISDYPDEIVICNSLVLSDFIDEFYTKICNGIINVLETQG